MRWIGALLNGKTRGSARSDFELVNAAILQETRHRDASESGEQRKIIVEASPSAGVLLETAPQVRRTCDSVATLSFPVSEPNRGTATVLALPEALLVAALVSRVGKHWHLYRSLVSRFAVFEPSFGSGCRIPFAFDWCRLQVSVLAKGDTTVTMIE